jgi:hypothetical protein
MRRHSSLLVAAFLVMAAAPNPDAFQRKCRAGAPVATCNYVVEKPKQTKNGQITLDVFRLIEMLQDQQKALAIEPANKHETTLTDIKAGIDNTKASFDNAVQACL